MSSRILKLLFKYQTKTLREKIRVNTSFIVNMRNQEEKEKLRILIRKAMIVPIKSRRR